MSERASEGMSTAERASEASSAEQANESDASERVNGPVLYASTSYNFNPLCTGSLDAVRQIRSKRERERPSRCPGGHSGASKSVSKRERGEQTFTGMSE